MKKKMTKEERVNALLHNSKQLNDISKDITRVMIFGIDPGRTSPGLARSRMAGGDLHHFNLKTKSKGFDKVMEVEKWIRNFFNKSYPAMVIMEDYAHESKFGREAQGEMQGIIMRLVWRLGVPLFKVAPPQIKAFVGAKSKDLIIKEVFRKWKIDVDTHDEADAVVLTKIGLALFNTIRFANTLTSIKDLTILEVNPHSLIDYPQKQARTIVNILVSKGEEAYAFSQGRKEAKEVTKNKKTKKRKS